MLFTGQRRRDEVSQVCQSRPQTTGGHFIYIPSRPSSISLCPLQLEVAEKSAKQLKETLEELESSVGAQSYPQHSDMWEEALKEKDKEVKKMRAAEKARVRLFTAEHACQPTCFTVIAVSMEMGILNTFIGS